MTYRINYTPRCLLHDIPIGGCFLAHGDCVYMRIGGEGDPFKCFRLTPCVRVALPEVVQPTM